MKQALRNWARARRAQRDAEWARRHAGPGGGPWPQRVVYLCPDSEKPTGGVKVIYQHVQALRGLGVDAHVMHLARGFRCRWFESAAPVLHLQQLRPGDHAVLPEVMPHMAARMRQRGLPYSMFVQNGYLVLEVSPPAETVQAYEGAAAVLSISEDTSELLLRLVPALQGRVLRVQPFVDAARFQPGDKQRLVTYMPRKMPQHARLLAGLLAAAHPAWQFQALHDMPETEVAAALSRSRLFLALGELEGFGLPPLEAALAGNLVLGYHGWGGREFFQPPLFHALAQGDVRAFLDRFSELATLAESADFLPRHAGLRDELAARYGREAEAVHLRRAAQQLGWLG